MSWFDSIRRYFITYGGGVAAVGALLVALLINFQEKFIYVPMTREYDILPTDVGLEYEDVRFESQDGTRLHSWFIKPQKGQQVLGVDGKHRVLLFLQANAGNMSHRLYDIARLTKSMGCAVFILGYRGYGHSEGTPTERGISHDSEAALDYLLTRDDVDISSIVLFGRSLGGAVATNLAVKRQQQVRGLILENTFTCIADMACQIMAPLKYLGMGRNRPLSFVLRNNWDTVGRIQQLNTKPILFIASQYDQMVPPQQMRQLYDKHGRAPWRWVDIPGGQHMDAPYVAPHIYYPAMTAFYSSLFRENGQAN